MDQDWRTLGLVVVGTAIAGWLMVRVLGDGSSRRTASPTAAVATIPLPHRTEAAIAAAGKSKPLRTATSAEPAPPLDPPAPSNDADETALIDRDLAMLAQGLRQDKEIEERVMPRVNGVFDQPNMTGYRRAPNFWESAFKSSGEMKP